MVGFGEFVGDALFAPGGMRLAQRDDLLLDRCWCPAGRFGGTTGKMLQGGISASDKARLPDIEGPPPHVGRATCQGDVARRFPCLEQEPPLLRRCERKMDMLVHETA